MSVLISDAMLVTLPEHDLATKYASAWSQQIINTAERNGIQIITVKGRSVTKSNVVNAIENKDPDSIIFNGHGSESIIAGHNLEPIIIFGENHHLLKNKIVHAFTCGSGKVLGKECEAKAFIGYNDWFFLCMDKSSTNRPLEDRFATPLMECALEAPIQLAKKQTARESFDKSQAKYQNWIDEYTASSSKYTTEELQLILPCLLWNKSCQALYGNEEAKLN